MIQSPMHLPLSTASGSTGQSLSARRSATRLFAFACVCTMTSFSFARVIATYSTRSSSAFASRRSVRSSACRATVGYWMCLCVSTHTGPSPSCGCTSTELKKSILLKRRARSERITTGNSRPFDLWIDMMRTPDDACAVCIEPASPSASCSRSVRTKSKRPCRPERA